MQIRVRARVTRAYAMLSIAAEAEADAAEELRRIAEVTSATQVQFFRARASASCCC